MFLIFFRSFVREMKAKTWCLLLTCLNFVLGSENLSIKKRETENSEVECGKSNITFELATRISFGRTVEPEMWPWMVGLYYGSILICGGTIGKNYFKFISSDY